ncbi:MAG: S-layer homology domain-containing protein [Ruminiclostridium sp.]|nr:S-layer homology domain-containing protein [Ruminiclostridium sp.]
MRKIWKKAIPVILSLAVAAGLAVNAGAAFSDYVDVKGHWAEDTLRQAYDDGILKGYDAFNMAPDHSITTAQAVTVLCRVLHVEGQADTSAFDIPANAWYAEDVAKAVYAGLLDEGAVGTLDQPISRGQAFQLFGRAFQMTAADPDYSLLDQFPDTGYLTGEIRQAAASLVEAGVVNGSDGSLQADRSLTRAEFATMLYRLAGNYTTAEDYTDKAGEGTVISGDAMLHGLVAGDLWFDHTSANVYLTNCDASLVAIRSDELKNFSISGIGTIDKLILANGSGDVNLTLPNAYRVGTLTVGEGSDDVTVAGDMSRVEVVDSGRTVYVNSSINSLAVSGDNNTIILKRGCSVGDIVIRGQGNTLQLNSKADTLLLEGRDNTVSGSGRVQDVFLNTQYYQLNVSKGTVTKWSNYTLSGVTVSLTSPDHLPAGGVLKATANLTVPEEHYGKLCTGSWYLNGELMEQESVLLGVDTPVSAFTPNYTHNMNLNGTLQFVLTYTNTDGDSYDQKASASVKLDTFSDLGLADTTITLNLPDTLAAGEQLYATALLDTPEYGKVCYGRWYVDGLEVSNGLCTLGKSEPYLLFRYDYYYGMPETSTVKLVLSYTTEDGRYQEVVGTGTLKLRNFADNGIAKATASLQAPAVLEPGATLNVTADLKYLEAGKTCTASWYVDGALVSNQTVTLGKDTPSLSYNYTYTEKMNLNSQVKLVLSYTTQDGRCQEVTASTNVKLKNYGYLYYHDMTEEELLKMVTNVYAGNYTLKWAQEHDYDPEIKTAWVNLKGYSSNTEYLVWVNLTYQRVNIFQGSQGNWELIRECLCGSGAPATPTIKGVFTTSYKQPSWNYGSYYCGPIVRFYGTSGYAFHSRLQYWPMNSDRYYDASIGYPVSHGCLRMYNDDIWFMYNNIPNGTTVVVH